MNQDNDMLVTLTLENDEEVTCAVLTLFEVEDKEYIALLPLDEDGDNEDGEVFLYRFIQAGDEEPELLNIESDEEYEIVADAFDEWLDTLEFDETEES
ncbi:hypothetical protein M2454_001656 [Aequitasia blattaphilus]|uniref:UPF0473 protein NK125_03655 n=1 Tax=Aequitasia blattaphilus TaxID=2949332 RepID=A0ABT1E6P5_9FIRM|nr:DUF1292 domain-containing protein [Aequitasia blattaphilus]MCP1101509.1 DUF1292 domain-containing protein [Aequitasia blattaphilus]MCR8614149.1 DUF1292 domain-containing protein [Aequitasia blattaphilus]